MNQINKEVILIILVVILLVWLVFPMVFPGSELFDVTTSEFVPVGYPRYGLRGEPLRRSSILKYFIRPDRNVRLSHSTGEMWVSNKSPTDEGIKDCRQVPCPLYHDGYDKLDTCWKCGSECRQKMKIPDIWPHVKS